MSISVEILKKELESIEENDSILQSVSALNQLIQEQGVKNWDLGTIACKNLADALRVATVRTPLGEAGVIESLSELLKIASGQQTKFQVQALRVLGNLCFDNENNRKRVKDAGIITTVATYLDSSQPDLIRTVCGFYLNSSMDYAPIQIEIAESGAAKGLIQLIQPGKEDDGSITMAIKVVDNLVAEDAARKVLATPSSVRIYITMMEHLYKFEEYLDNLDMLENLADTLLQIIMDDDNLQNEIIDMGALNTLLDFLENTEIEISDKEEKEKLEEVRKTISKISIYATSTDSKMDELYNNRQVLARFLSMAESKSEVVHQCAVYALGNLARSDEHCIELVEKYNLSKLLLNLYQSTENATFQYAILGCLKHLCLPASNKDIIGSDDCISILSPVLEESKDMLKRNQFLTIGIIKLLCIGNYKNAKAVVENGALSLVISFIKRVDDVAAKSEATRVLTNLVKTVWVQKDNQTLRRQIIDMQIIEPIIELIRTSTFPILKNDGLMALTLIFSDLESKDVLANALPLITAEPPIIDISQEDEKENESQSQQKPELRSFLNVAVDDICSNNSELPIQIKCNICVLLLKIVQAAESLQNQATIEAIRSSAASRLGLIADDSELYKYAHTLVEALKQ